MVTISVTANDIAVSLAMMKDNSIRSQHLAVFACPAKTAMRRQLRTPIEMNGNSMCGLGGDYEWRCGLPYNVSCHNLMYEWVWAGNMPETILVPYEFDIDETRLVPRSEPVRRAGQRRPQPTTDLSLSDLADRYRQLAATFD